MTTETIHVIMAFKADKRGKLKPETPMRVSRVEDAVRKAERMSATFDGVVALSQSVDADTGEVDENPKILFRAGRLPPDFDD